MFDQPVHSFLVIRVVLSVCLVAAGLTAGAGNIITIGEVQGIVRDTDVGRKHITAYKDQQVRVQGVIYQKTLNESSRGDLMHGVFIQNIPQTADQDPDTSDGIFVFMNRYTSFRDKYVPKVGDEVVIEATAGEYHSMTQLKDAKLIKIIRSGVNIDREVPTIEIRSPADRDKADRYWEKLEGMRVRVPAGSTAQGGRSIHGKNNAEIMMAPSSRFKAVTALPHARRVFRDPHPLDNQPDELFDDGNHDMFLLASHGLKGAVGNTDEMLPVVQTFDELSAPVTGGVYYSYGKYLVEVDAMPVFESPAVPSGNHPPLEAEQDREYSLATFNVENLFDFRDDPFDQNDFQGNAGENNMKPPFNYIPENVRVYRERLHHLALQVVSDLKSPDIVLIQEAEDQDICREDSGKMNEIGTDDADGSVDCLQELAKAIIDAGGPEYQVATDRDGVDYRGIICAYMYRKDRVELVDTREKDMVFSSNPKMDFKGTADPINSHKQNPKALNAMMARGDDLVMSRAALAGHFRIKGRGGKYAELYLVNNHFSSGPARRVEQRRQQAAFNASLVRALQASEPNARIIVGGDLNVYPRPDDPFSPGMPEYPSDQLAALYETGMINLYDTLVAEVPENAYTYVYRGQAQTLDHLFVSPTLKEDLVQVRVAHINADYTSEDFGTPGRGASDHDPVVARFRFE
jgi:predicted extracellular nuclease